MESWLVDHVVIEGGPGDPECWQKLTNLLGRTWAHESGQHLTIARLAIDTGYETSAVYAWARQVGFAQVAPVKGLEGFNRASPVTGPTYVDATIGGKRLRRGARLWSVATSTFKAETYRFLRQDRPTPEEITAGAAFSAGTVHLPTWADGEWLKQLTAEQLVTIKSKRGFTKLEWQKLRERNEALDCRVYARAAAGFHRHQARRQLTEERQHLIPSQLLAQDTKPRRVSAMHLKHILRKVEPDRGNLRHDRPPLWIIADPPWHIDAVGGRSHHQRLRDGWYDNRGPFQRRVLLALGLGAVAVLLLGLYALRRDLGRNMAALIGLAFVAGFVMMRAVGYHGFDALINTRVEGVRMNWVLEWIGPLLICANALTLRRDAKRRADPFSRLQ